MVRQSARKVAQAMAAAVESKTPVARAVGASGASVKTKAKIETTKTKVSKRKTTPSEPELNGEDVENISPAEDKKPAPKKRKTTKKTAEGTLLATRTAVASLKREMHIGAHVSSAGGVQNSIENATHIGANAFALFLKSQRKWTSPPLADEAKTQFHAMLKQHSYDARKHILPHGSYLVNLAQADEAKATQAYDNFLDDLQRCEALGITLYNFHPGSTGGATMKEACGRIAAQLNRAHKATETVVTLLENMCGSGNVVGSRFEELRDIIALVDDKARVGVCIDTCHAFAAGYDLRTPAAFTKTMAEFDSVVGMKYLRAFHLNDSKAPFGSHRDLHANIGTGCLGLRAFHSIMNHEPLQGLPMVLETPIDEKGPDGKTVENKQIWADEIKLLESLVGMDADSAEFKEKEKELNAKGASERQKIQEQVDKKAEKDAKKGTKGKAKGRKSKKDEESCDSCGESD
ncbi:xylose isomerase-like protein [Chaetomium fimeti]|uniref:Apurinic-apyrimidinic endonuclease 1 n=1 Tax=Chaetomium fimeti TaxID=1854472 RepID=A0AAE0HQU6_9PEZI|nr:xylose isomerase-like protein [Chaetomium fimeti]